MHGTTPEKTDAKPIRLGNLAEEINNAYREATGAGAEAVKIACSSVAAAIRAGKLLAKAKRVIGHGSWLKWLSDNCPDISDTTATRWMKLGEANNSQLKNLNRAKNLTQAYRAIGIIPESLTEPKALGTATVDEKDRFAINITKKAYAIFAVTEDFIIDDIGDENLEKMKKALQPVINFGAKLGVQPELEPSTQTTP